SPIYSVYQSFAFTLGHRNLYSFPTRRSSDLAAELVEPARLHRHDPVRALDPHLAARHDRLALREGAVETSVEILVALRARGHVRSEEHTTELQSPYDIVCGLLLEKKKH